MLSPRDAQLGGCGITSPPDTDQSPPTIQSTDAQALPLTARGVPTRDEIGSGPYRMPERSTKAPDYSGLGQSGEDQGVAGQQGICRNPKVGEKYATFSRGFAVEGVPQ
jgi:hypothetical protein